MDRTQRVSRLLIAATKKAGGELTLTPLDLADSAFQAVRLDEQPDGSIVVKVITLGEAIVLGEARQAVERVLGPGPGREGTGL